MEVDLEPPELVDLVDDEDDKIRVRKSDHTLEV